MQLPPAHYLEDAGCAERTTTAGISFMNDYSAVRDAPTGTVTFLFTDVETGNRLWAQYPQQLSAALERQEQILRAAAQANGGPSPRGGSFFVSG